MLKVTRRHWLIRSTAVLCSGTWFFSLIAKDRRRTPIHMMNYVRPEDFPLMKELNINTALVELAQDGSDWRQVYDVAVRHNLQIVPLIWGKDQSIWQWNPKANEWELDQKRYPKSIGAQFLRFLLDHPQYREQTLAIYSFHEPLAQLERTNPSRLRKFYQQITEEIFPKGVVYVYGEDMTFVWPQGEECLTGVLDYEVHTFYPYSASAEGRYRPFLPEGHYGKPTSDLKQVLDLQNRVVELQLSKIKQAKPARTGRKPELIVILQTFMDPTQKGLWDRMPDADEMSTVANYLIDHLGDRLAGIAWYCFRQAATHYKNWLHRDRYDTHRRDRWQVIADVGKKLQRL